ncbi:hypothetical protein AB0J90_03510 [Micromonospora sp. NPDC049523]|uniref:hypothetical protein n=1 Tax=Micromonospora sp. NPDC049523 TaxID=3155921 RepID=UPI003418AB9F
MLESVGDFAAVRTLRFLLATSATDPLELARTTRRLLDARLDDPSLGAVHATVDPAAALGSLRSAAARAFHAVNTRLAREFDARLADVRAQAEQQLAAGIGDVDGVLAQFDTGIAQLAYDLEMRLWSEIGWLAAGLAHDADERGLAHLAARLPAPLRRIPVTLRIVEQGGPAPTTGEALEGMVKAARLLGGLHQLSGLAIDPTGLLPAAAAIAAVSARQRWVAQQRAARNAALARVAESCEKARTYLLDPVYRAATQAQFVLLDQAMAAVAQAELRPEAVAAYHPTGSAIRSIRDRAAGLERELTGS